MYKLIATDMDGTLLNSQSTIPEKNIEAIKLAKRKGAKVILCTGRPITGVRDFAKILGLTDKGDYAITQNGAIIYDSFTNKIISSNLLSKKDILNFYKFSQNNNLELHFCYNNKLITPAKEISFHTIQEAYLCNIAISVIDNIEDISNDICPSNITLVVENEKTIIDLIQEAKALFGNDYSIVHSSNNSIEISNKNANKGNAVKYIAEKIFNIKREEIITIGDQNNDLTMIEYAGLGVAMGNAINSIKEISNEITLTNDESGLAHIIEKYIL